MKVGTARSKTKSRATQAAAHSQAADGEARSPTDVAIATELAPAVAIALLNQSEHAPGDPSPALEPLAAGAQVSEVDGQLRVQLLFDNGAVLPVELSEDAAAALAKGIEKALPQH